MTDKFILTSHIQKLGHKIQEIRERALFNIISKLDHGFVYDNDLARSKEILIKLFDWFSLEPCSKEDVVLKLIKRILQTETGAILIKHYGIKNIISELKQIKSTLNQKHQSLIDEILENIQYIVPPLECEVPLSHRTEYSEPLLSNSVGTTATSIRGIIFQDGSLEQEIGRPPSNSDNPEKTIRQCSCNQSEYFPCIILPWQPLISQDLHVLESVEESLRNPPQPSALLHSCEFFINVMLHDFPAEIFLQRPTIVQLLQNILNTSESTRIKTAALNCLNKLTKCLHTRINYYCDPGTFNLKNINTNHFQRINSPRYEKNYTAEQSYMQSYRSTSSSSSQTYEDAALLKTKQLSLLEFCFTMFYSAFSYLQIKHVGLTELKKRKNQISLNVALTLLDKILLLLSICVKQEIWEERENGAFNFKHKFNDILGKFGDLLEFYRLEVVSNDCDRNIRAVHLYLLHISVNLLLYMVPLNKADMILPRNFKNALASTVLDCSFAKLYMNAHEVLVAYVQSDELMKTVDSQHKIAITEFGGVYESDSLKKYNNVKNVSTSITSSVKFMKIGKSCSLTDSITLAKEGLLSLEFHKNFTFIKIFIELCANKLPMQNILSNSLFEVDDIVVSLLAFNEASVREEMYSLCQKRVAAAIGPKLNISKTGAPGTQILFLLRPAIIQEITLHGITSDNKKISKYAQDILLHLLKCKILVNDDIWNLFVEAIIPNLPILLCHAGKNDAFGRTLISILDPDKAQNLFIPTLEILKGNSCLLFVDDNLARGEAVSRLCWILASENETRDMLPKLNNLQDKALGSACILKRTSDLNKMRGIQHFYQPSSLNQVLELLNSENVEPVIRRSAITQISVMMEDPLLHIAFLEKGGLKTIINLMKTALTENDYRDYPDSVIPAICVLKNICLYNQSIRQELGNNLQVYHYVLRGLFLYCTEGRMKQDGSTLLFLLLFTNFTIGTPSKGDMSLPHLVFDKLYVPFTCNVHWKNSKHTKPNLSVTLLQDKWCLTSIQIHWNSEWYGGFDKLLKCENIDHTSEEFNYSEVLKLNENDLLALKSSSLEFCIKKYLQDIQNGTSHSAIADSIHKYVNIYSIAKESDMKQINFLCFPWENTFTRFLNAPPSSEDDSSLLTSVLKFLSLLVPFYKHSDRCWILEVIKTPFHSLFNLLRNDPTEPEDKLLNQELLSLVTVCACNEQHYLDFHTAANEHLKIKASLLWPHIITIIAENLQFSDAQHFYNLAYLDCLLSCLVHLTSTLGWSKSKADLPPKVLLTQLISRLCELIGAFHCGKGPSAASSFMGLSITRHLILILNHLLVEMQNAEVKEWEMCFLGEDIGGESTLSSLCALWRSRDIVLRAAVIQLFSGLSISSKAAAELTNVVKGDKGKGIVETALQVLLDHTEASIVRENAAILLANLFTHTMPTVGDKSTLTINITPLTIYKSNNMVDLILKMLEESNYYKELEAILLYLYTESKFSFGNKCKCHPIDYKSSDDSIIPNESNNINNNLYARAQNVPQSLRSSSTDSNSVATDSVPVIISTPGLIKAISVFTYNLMALAVEDVAAALQENNLIKMFFRCIVEPKAEINNTKELAVYCDILEMNTAICLLLSRAASKNHICLGTVLHTRDCLKMMLSLLNPALYDLSLPQLIYLRNKLWCEIFVFIGVLLESYLSEDNTKNHKAGEAIAILSALLKECGHEPFLQTLCEAISLNSFTDLQTSALNSLTSLLKLETNQHLDAEPINNELENSMQNLLDFTKTPRTSSIDDNIKENLENIEPNSSKTADSNWSKLSAKNRQKYNILEDIYFENFNNATTLSTKNKTQSSPTVSDSSADDTLMAGAELCKILLHLYDIIHLKSTATNYKKKCVIINTLTSVLCVSREAKRYALRNGLIEIAIKQMKDIHIKLSLESADCLRRVGDKKRLSPVLKELESLIGLLTNFMLNDRDVKYSAAVLGLSDLIHKLWIWFLVQRTLLTDVLKLLCTFTTNCAVACQSFPLTSPVAGSGPRKVPSNLSLLHAIFSLIGKEMEQVTRTHELTILQLAFHLLQNTCSVVECRILLSKSSILQHLSRLHPAITKRQKPWESVELLWLNFLESLTGYPEGQALVAKFPDALELIISFAGNSKIANRKVAMFVLRNVAFYQPNRTRLITSDDFLHVLQTKLANGSYEDKNIVVSIIWALAANNQKAKLILKCAGLDVKLQETIKYLQLSKQQETDINDIQRMHYVLTLLKEGDKNR